MLLPFPPSLNAYYRNVNGRTLISAEGRAYRNAILACPDVGKAARWPEDQRLAVSFTAFPPDNRRRDLDNMLKCVCDALTYAGIYADDSQIDRLLIERGTVTPGGALRVIITPLAGHP